MRPFRFVQARQRENNFGKTGIKDSVFSNTSLGLDTNEHRTERQNQCRGRVQTSRDPEQPSASDQHWSPGSAGQRTSAKHGPDGPGPDPSSSCHDIMGLPEEERWCWAQCAVWQPPSPPFSFLLVFSYCTYLIYLHIPLCIGTNSALLLLFCTSG